MPGGFRFRTCSRRPLRPSELQKAISEISAKVLTQTLRGMERDGLLVRKVHAVVPPKVEYQLTSMGESLLESLRQLCLWVKGHVKERESGAAGVRSEKQLDGAQRSLKSSAVAHSVGLAMKVRSVVVTLRYCGMRELTMRVLDDAAQTRRTH